MYYIKKLIYIGLFFCASKSIAQESFESLSESAFSVNHKFSSVYKANFAIKSRAYIYQNDNLRYKQRQVDIVHFSTYSLNHNNSLSLGIQYRNRDLFEDKSNELRLTQQYNFTKKRLSKRFGHRFRVEQRFLEAITVHRIRYRFALDFPLKGDQLDINEAYFISSMELLNSMNALSAPEIDHRTTVQIGWLLSEKINLQAGLEYRFEAFNIITEQKLFILTSAILKI
ncbi:DUF2490 domain-containing protein [Lacinutrix cladophorae]